MVSQKAWGTDAALWTTASERELGASVRTPARAPHRPAWAPRARAGHTLTKASVSELARHLLCPLPRLLLRL